MYVPVMNFSHFSCTWMAFPLVSFATYQIRDIFVDFGPLVLKKLNNRVVG